VCLCYMDFVSGSNIEFYNNAVYSRNRLNGHCMRQIASSTCTSSLSLFRYIWVLIKHCTSLWWPKPPRFVVVGTNYTQQLQLFSKKNLWNEKVAKDPKSSQIQILERTDSQKTQKVAKYKFWNELTLKRAKLWVLAPKEIIWQPLSAV